MYLESSEEEHEPEPDNDNVLPHAHLIVLAPDHLERGSGSM